MGGGAIIKKRDGGSNKSGGLRNYFFLSYERYETI